MSSSLAEHADHSGSQWLTDQPLDPASVPRPSSRAVDPAAQTQGSWHLLTQPADYRAGCYVLFGSKSSCNHKGVAWGPFPSNSCQVHGVPAMHPLRMPHNESEHVSSRIPGLHRGQLCIPQRELHMLHAAWVHTRGHGPHAPVHLFLHVRGVTAAVVRQEQPPVVQPVSIDLNVAAVHDEDKHSQGLPGHLWGQAHIRIPMTVVHGLAGYSCPGCGQRLQAEDTGSMYHCGWWDCSLYTGWDILWRLHQGPSPLNCVCFQYSNAETKPQTRSY